MADSRQRFGANRLTPLPREPLWKKFLEKFDEPIIKILLAAAAAVDGRRSVRGRPARWAAVGARPGRRRARRRALRLKLRRVGAVDAVRRRRRARSSSASRSGHSVVEGLAVMIAVILATGVAFLSEYKSDREFEMLNAQKDSLQVKVMRDGEVHTVAARRGRRRRPRRAGDGRRDPRRRPAAQGDRAVRRSVADDRRVRAGRASTPGPDDDTADGPEQPGCLYRGTQVVDGVGQMVVTEVGDDTMTRPDRPPPVRRRGRGGRGERRRPTTEETRVKQQADHLQGADAAAGRS